MKDKKQYEVFSVRISKHNKDKLRQLYSYEGRDKCWNQVFNKLLDK